MTRIRKNFIRRSGFRDSKLFIIATEGEKTEPKYFRDLASRNYYYSPRVHVEVLKRLSSSSSPNHIIRELDKFRSEYNLNRNDELWMIIDLNSWSDRHLSDVTTKCIQKGYYIAISNPCFEIWLLLHLKDINDDERERIERFSCRDLKSELRRILGSYNPSNPDTSKFLPYISEAVERGRILDVNPDTRWPNSIGTRVYLLVETILNS